MGDAGVKYDDNLWMGDYVEEESDKFTAMITVKYDTVGQGLDISEFVALARGAHAIHLCSCCPRHMTGFYNLPQSTTIHKERYEMHTMDGERSFYKDGLLKLATMLNDGNYHLDLPIYLYN